MSRHRDGFDSRTDRMRVELERLSVGPTHRRTGFDSLLAHSGPVPSGTLRWLCSCSSRDRSGGRSPGSYPGGRRFESDSRNFARVVEPPGRHTGSRGQRASRPMRVRPSPRALHSRPGGGTTGRHTSLRSWRSRRACEFDSRPGHCDVQVAETVDTPRSKRGALAGVRVRLPPWTTMEGEPARCRRRLEPGGPRKGVGIETSALRITASTQAVICARFWKVTWRWSQTSFETSVASSSAWGSSPPPSAWRVNAGWSAARLESGAVPREAEDRALRSPQSWNVRCSSVNAR